MSVLDIENNLPLICECGNRDHGHPGVECSAECGRPMTLDVPRLIEWAYGQGWKRGVTMYAVWRDGEQLVGIMQKPLREVLGDGPDQDYLGMDLAVNRDQFPGKK